MKSLLTCMAFAVLVHIVYTWHRERIKHVVLDPENLETTPMPEGIWPETGPGSLEHFKQTTTQMR